MLKLMRSYAKPVLCLTLFLFLLVMIPNASAYPLPIYGSAEIENSMDVNGATVVVSASGYPNETTTVSDGSWQVDVGAETGTEWAQGTSFTVTITKDQYLGTKKGELQGKYIDVGKVVLRNTQSSQNDDVSNGLNDTSENNVVPVAIISSGSFYEAEVNENIVFSAIDSYDENGSIIGYRWDFDGDGKYDTNWKESYSTVFSYSESGIYTLFLQVKDDSNETAVDSAVLDISSKNSAVEIKARNIGFTSQNITFQAESTFNCSSVNYTWYLGDGTIKYNPQIFHTYKSPGIYYVKVYIRDRNDTVYHDVHDLKIKLDTDKDLLHDELEKSIGSPIWSKNYYSSIQINAKSHLLVDIDNDQYFDVFYNTTCENSSQLTFEKDLYLIDDDLDGVYDYSYNKTNGKLTKYIDESSKNNTYSNEDANGKKQESPGISVIMFILTIFLISIYSGFFKKKKRRR